MTDSAKRPFLIGGIIVVILIVIGAVALTSRDSGSGDESKGNNTAAGASADTDHQAEDKFGVARRDAKDMAGMGDVNAPVVLVEFSDYRCPFCGVFARDTLPKLKAEYIDTGKVRYERRDLPVFGAESVLGAMAARAAGEQGKYWQYHEAVYADAPERGHLKIDDAKVMAWAKEVGVPDLPKFQADLKNPVLSQMIDHDMSEGQSLGATGTPAFIIGSTPIFGAQPIKAFRDAINKELEQAGKSE